jgi:D-alanyl-D-alanine carboxypeptidase/D-alanyl-D-alanine-endopeptidase (penicillin-binding protein 4)
MVAGALLCAWPASALEPVPPRTLQQRVEARLGEAGPGVRFGLVVAAEDGTELVAIAPDGRFMPASNTKMFTTAAAFATLAGLDLPDSDGGASVWLTPTAGAAPDLILEGHGDARLSSAPDCRTDCLATLADAVAAKTRSVRDVVGDDSFFPDQRWSPGMSWNNIPTRSGTGISALSLDDNELRLSVAPAAVGQPPTVQSLAYYGIDNRAVTVAGGKTELGYDRLPGTNLVRLTGTIAKGAEPETLRLGIDDPAHYAAWRLRSLIEARGVRVTGATVARHRQQAPTDDPAVRAGAPVPRRTRAPALASLVAPPLAEDLAIINKISQNLHAELMLRRLGRTDGSGSIADGVVAVRAMLDRARVPRAAWDFSDGSGMSTYNRIAPRGTVTLLRWIAAQPWGAQWRSTLPIGGVDGTLARRFGGTSLERRIFAKTGTINASFALSGYMIARSGRTLTFSALANDVPEGVSATEAIDSVLAMVAAEN